jgi:hypothetical protein
MKKIFLLVTLTSNICFLNAQKIVYKTVKIANWTLESFPTNYIVAAKSTHIERNPYNKKIKFYQELNSVGDVNGLVVVMQENLQFPHDITYYRNGDWVYRAYFFGSSNIAYEIENRNIDGQLNGPQIKREKSNNSVGYTTKTEHYENGVTLKQVEIDKKNPWTFDKNGNLQGFFSYSNEDSSLSFSGNAIDGIIQNVKLFDQNKGYVYSFLKEYKTKIDSSCESNCKTIEVTVSKHFEGSEEPEISHSSYIITPERVILRVINKEDDNLKTTISYKKRTYSDFIYAVFRL